MIIKTTSEEARIINPAKLTKNFQKDKWENEKDRTADKDTAKKLSILSYNVLAELACDEHTFPFYDKKALSFDDRFLKTVEQMKILDADIICLQEFDHFGDKYEQALPNLGYELHYYPRKTRNDGRLIGLKKSRELTLLSVGHLDYDFNHKYPSNFDFKRDSLALHLQIKDQKYPKIFNIMDTNLYWDEKLDYLYMKFYVKEDEPVFLCGNLNSSPNTNTIRELLELKEPKKERCDEVLSKNYKFYEEIYQDIVGLNSTFLWKGAYEDYKSKIAPEDGNQGFPDNTVYTNDSKMTLDHIFYTPDTLRPLTILKSPTPEEISSESLLSVEYPSEHLSVMSIFEYAD